MIKVSWKNQLLGFLFITVISWILFFVQRTDFTSFIIGVAASFGLYFWILTKVKSESFLLGLFILIGTISVFSIPELSNDFYRFLWDGEITNLGFNPFDFTPREFIIAKNELITPYLLELYDGCGELSQYNYSTYPSVNQFYFVVATVFTDNTSINLILLKSLGLITIALSIPSARRILQLLQLPSQRLYSFLLNPLLILEALGNIHFEGVMFSFLIIAIDFLSRKRILLSTLFFAFAIQVKLIPLIFLPVLLRFLGWKKSIIYYTSTIAISILLFIIYIDLSNYENYLKSLNLYFGIFEFNSYIMHWYIEYGKMKLGFNALTAYGPRLGRLALFIILTVSFYGGQITLDKMLKRMLFIFMIYLLFTSTVHPWYIITLIGLSVFTKYSFAIIWSILIFVTYHYYSHWSSNETVFRMLIHIEYILLFASILYELITLKTILKFLFPPFEELDHTLDPPRDDTNLSA